MSYKKTETGVKYLVQNELDMACEDNGDYFNSNHEAYAVILEEKEEAEEEIFEINRTLNMLWEYVRTNMKIGSHLAEIEEHAINAACEAIQIAAMARKAMR